MWPGGHRMDHGSSAGVACFVRGTAIATTAGPRPVEALEEGDMVVSALGGAVPVVWIGHRNLDCRRHPRPAEVTPIRIRAHAFGPGQPVRDLRLGPGHAVMLRDVLVPVHLLAGGAGILRERPREVTYLHVELAAHDVLLAEGAAVESCLPGDRARFANGGVVATLHPDFSFRPSLEPSCLELLRGGPELSAVRAELAAHAAAEPRLMP